MRANPTAHTRHAADSAGSSCYNCHMPYTTYGLLKTIRSHTVGSPTVKESVDTGRPNACNLCHLDRTLAWTDDALAALVQARQPFALGEDEQTVAASLLVAAERRRRPARHRLAGHGVAARSAGLRRGLDGAVSRAVARRPVRRGPLRRRAIDDDRCPASAPLRSTSSRRPRARRQAQLRTMATWDRTRVRPGRAASELLMTASGDVDIPRVLALLKQRNNRAMLLRE